MKFYNLVLLAATNILILLTVSSCGDDKQTGQQEILRPVKTVLIEAPGIGLGRDFIGVVDAAQKAKLGFRVAGKLKEITVKEGEHVKKGQVIATLDQTDFKIKLKDKQASYDKAKADFSRAEKLLEPGHISRADYDSLKAKLSTASAQLAAAQQNLKYTVLRAPFAGRIARRFVENYEEVAAKQEIVALQDISSLTIQINVPETVMIRVKRGASQHKLYAKFAAIKDKKFPLIFKEVATQADDATQTYAVTFTMFAVEAHTILPGMSVTVSAEQTALTDKESASVYLPAHAVLEDTRGRFVYVVHVEDDQIGVIRRRLVTTGKLTELGIEVTAGLNIGDQVVTAGMSKMTEGKRVRLLSGDKR